MSTSTIKEYQLVHYTPISCNGMIPPVLPPCVDKLPSEKKIEQEKQREERRRKQNELNKNKKKNVFTTIGTAVASVANATAEAITTISDDIFHETQAPGAEGRFRKYFPGFPNEKLIAEYEARLVSSPESMMHGRCYISSNFFSFHAEQHGKYILVMLALKGIQSIQKAVVTKPPPGIPSHYPPQFHIIVGGELAQEPGAPRIDSLVIYTMDGMQHMFFDIKHFNEMYCVLDHAWRDPNPQFNECSTPPEYSKQEFIENSLRQQMVAYNEIAKFKQSSQNNFAEQQFHQQKNHVDEAFFEQQQTLNNMEPPPLYPEL